MPLVLDATPGGANANAYVSLSDATAAATFRVGASAWLALTTDQQMQSIATATCAIDTLEFTGSKSDEDQALEFPRDGATTIPSRVEQATIDLAISYAPSFASDGSSTDPLSPVANNIKREKVDVIETEYFAPVAPSDETGLSAFPPTVQRLLGLYVLYDSIVSQWGTGTAVRGS